MKERLFRPHAAHHLSGKSLAVRRREKNDRPSPRRLAGPQVGPHLEARQHPLHQRLHRAARGLVAQQPRLDDLGVVEHY